LPEARLPAAADHVFGGISFIRRLEQLSRPTRDNGVWGTRKTTADPSSAGSLRMTARIAQSADLAARSAKTSRAAYRPLSAAGKPA
jgi:hypothetical protein